MGRDEFLIGSAENEKFRVQVFIDSDPMNPREHCDGWLGKMVCAHKRYSLGDEQANTEDYTSWGEWLEYEVLNVHGEDNVVYLPLFLYDHSGITMNTTGFNCGWDSGQVGWIYCLMKDIDEAYLAKDFNRPEKVVWAQEVMRREVEEYDHYLCGDVFGYMIEEKKGCPHCGVVEYEDVDSCWGFVGRDACQNGMLEHASIPDPELDRLFMEALEEGGFSIGERRDNCGVAR